MITFLLTTLLAASAAGLGLTWLVYDTVAYRPIRRAIRDGRVDALPGSRLRPFGHDAFGINPDSVVRYVVYDVPEGHVGVVRTRRHPAATYYSLTLYDTLLQTLPRLPGRGPTFLADRHLEAGTEGAFLVVLTREPGRWANALDIGAERRGVLVERHFGGAPAELGTLEVLPEKEAHALSTAITPPSASSSTRSSPTAAAGAAPPSSR